MPAQVDIRTDMLKTRKLILTFLLFYNVTTKQNKGFSSGYQSFCVL